MGAADSKTTTGMRHSAVAQSVAVKSRQHCEASECRLEACRKFAHVGRAGGGRREGNKGAEYW